MKPKIINLKIVIHLLLVLLPFIGLSQTTIISPTGDGGFETGTDFASNNWTATTGAATRNQ